MSDTDPVSRRGLLRAAAGATAAGGVGSATAGTASAQSEQPDFSELEGIDGGIEDLRGESAVTVAVGASGNGGDYAFSPAGIWIDSGTTVTWEWTGQGSNHNVETVDGPARLESETVSEEGFTYEFEFTEEHAGITNYQCSPHASLGMLGAVAVGDDVPTVEVGGGGGGGSGGAPLIPDSAKTLGLATFVAMVSTLGFAFFFLKYGGDYEDTA